MAAREIAVIGGGLIGLATACALLRRGRTELHVTLYEKEVDVGRHQSTHNSGGHRGPRARSTLSRARFVRALQRLIPEITAADLVPSGSGVRVQPLYRDGRLAQDFLLPGGPRRGARAQRAQPGRDRALAIGERVAHRVLGAVGPGPEREFTLERP